MVVIVVVFPPADCAVVLLECCLRAVVFVAEFRDFGVTDTVRTSDTFVVSFFLLARESRLEGDPNLAKETLCSEIVVYYSDASF